MNEKEIIENCVSLNESFEGATFQDLINITTQYCLIPIDLTNNNDRQLIDTLKLSAQNFLEYSNRIGQRYNGNRINDVGKKIEEAFVEELKKTNYIPELLGSSGYPDIKLLNKNNTVVAFLESKAVSQQWDSTFRSFYYTSGKKIDADAHHLVIAWKIIEESPKYWKLIGWKLCNLYNLKMGLKMEFYSNNKKLYSSDLIIATNEL